MANLAVVAIGGNSLIKGPDRQSIPDQWEAMAETCGHIAAMIARGWDIVITHGNGPQVGFILLRSELASHVLHTVPLDICGADTQGAIGYMAQVVLDAAMAQRGLGRRTATVVTRVVVDAEDPAFKKPSKPIGPFYTQEQADRHHRERGWAVMEDAGRGWRRVVPSPRPLEIIETDAIRALLGGGFVVVGVGGGGIPVIREDGGRLRGVEAVIDKDLASSLLARTIGADLLLISTAVERVALNYKKPGQRFLDTMTLEDARGYLGEGHFPSGS
ncbi:MAG: carbamate kinase, partial [Armatimonadetes bacterium]|nr:carbamate kinase [Armatimonadota bacterium]